MTFYVYIQLTSFNFFSIADFGMSLFFRIHKEFFFIFIEIADVVEYLQ